VNYENKFLLLFSATFGFMYDAKQKTKPSQAQQRSTVWQFVSTERFGDVRCEVVLRVLLGRLGRDAGLVNLCKL